MVSEALQLSFTLGSRNVLRNPRRSILTMLAIAVGLLGALALAALSRGVSTQVIEDAINNLTGHIQIHAPGYLDDPVLERSFTVPPDIEEVLARPEIEAYSLRIRLPGVVRSERESAGVTLVGVSAGEIGTSFYGTLPMEGEWITSPTATGVVLGRALAEQLQTERGKRVVLMTENRNNSIADRGFPVVGLFRAELEATEKAYAFVGRETLSRLVGVSGSISEIAIRLKRKEDTAPLTRALQKKYPELDVQPWTTLEPLAVAMSQIQEGFLTIWYLIVVVAISFGLVNTLFMSVMERIRELGLFQALGMKPRLILAQVFMESLVLLVAGTILGNLIAWGLLVYFDGGIDISQFARGAQMTGIGSILPLRLTMGDIVFANLMIVILTLAACLYPAQKAAKLAPIEALRTT